MAFKSAGGATTFSLLKKTPDRDCQPVKRDLLRQRLGNAYNQRYMAMDDTDLQYKANQSPSGDQEQVTKPKNVTKRSVDNTDPSAWTCQTTKVWLDLGVIKEFRGRNGREDEKLKNEVLHEANVIANLGDHQGLPFLFGVQTKTVPYGVVLQFLGT